MSRVRIAITGLGLVTPLGCGRDQTWLRLQNGESGVKWLSTQECGANPLSAPERWYGAPVDLPSDLEFDPNRSGNLSALRNSNLSRTSQFALIAAQEALAQAKILVREQRSLACVLGTSKTDLRAVDSLFESLSQKSGRGTETEVSPLFPSDPATQVAARLGIEGPLHCPVAACATGLVSIIRAAEMIRHGTVKIALAGSSDSSLHPGLLASYRRLGVLAKPGLNPQEACRPFARDRSGFVVGEGAAVMTLECWDEAMARGATPLAEWVDGILGSDPSGLTSVDATGRTLAELIQRLLLRNEIEPQRISAICYHGTATLLNDLAEARGVRQSLQHVPLGFGIKGALGHLMGAAGSVETACSVLALRDQQIPPTMNHVQHDPECPNRVTGSAAVGQPIEYLLKTSLGFGGHLAVGLLKRVLPSNVGLPE